PCMGHGVAFSHGKIHEVSEMKIALGISRAGISCDAPDGRLVHLLFVLATNPAMYEDHLNRLSILAKMARMEHFRSEILSCFGQKEAEEKLKETYSLFCEKQAV
ncbi:MAG: PTS sugar transporter subunit IIA, partial [Spirochaetaceae bacterium]|nr:PTS sugar transporter subunit IIA [Spirochaetaceae bacterium]